MFEVRGETLYWMHYPVAEIRRDISLAVRRRFEDAILLPDECTVNYDRLENELANIQQQAGYLTQLANRLVTRAEDIKPDMIPLEVCVTQIDISDHVGNMRHTATRLGNIVTRIEDEIYEP